VSSGLEATARPQPDRLCAVDGLCPAPAFSDPARGGACLALHTWRRRTTTEEDQQDERKQGQVNLADDQPGLGSAVTPIASAADLPSCNMADNHRRDARQGPKAAKRRDTEDERGYRQRIRSSAHPHLLLSVHLALSVRSPDTAENNRPAVLTGRSTDAIDTVVQVKHVNDDKDDDGSSGALVPAG
jgi:hypothetical protein